MSRVGGRSPYALVLAWFLTLTAPAAAQSDAELDALNRQGLELFMAGKYDEATQLAGRYAEAVEARYGPDDPRYAAALINLSQLLKAANRLAEAEQHVRRALAIHERSFGSENVNVARALTVLAGLLQATNRLAEAEPLYRRALAIDEKSLGPEDPAVATDVNDLAVLLQARNRLAEAEPLYRRALIIDEKSYGAEHYTVAIALNNLAEALAAANRLAEAEPLYRRALAINEKSFGPEHPTVASILNNLAKLLRGSNRLSEAEPLHRRALATDERSFGPDHPKVAISLSNLAVLLQDTNRLAEAEPLARRALAIQEKSFGPEHPDVAASLENLAQLLVNMGRLAEAEPLLRRALAIFEKGLGPDHPAVANCLVTLAVLRAELGDWKEAAQFHKRAKPILTSVQGMENEGLARAVLARNSRSLRGSALALRHADANSADAREESFELAQWALQSGAADALSQMALRFAKGTGPLADLVRERQDLIERRQGEDKRLLAAVGRADTTTDLIRADIADLDAKVVAIDQRLATKFPDYAQLSNPKPPTIATVQSLLKQDEALVLFLDVPAPRIGKLSEETLAWAVTKGTARWVSIPLGTSALTEWVAALRCGLDGATWDGKGSESCATRLSIPVNKVPKRNDPLPFDLARAHELYKGLFGGIEDLIKDKHLLIVPSGALTSLPFQVLVTAAPAGGDIGSASWLIRDHALTVLPSVASLAALRRNARASAAPEPFIGFGNPVLTRSCGPVFIPDRCPEDAINVAAAEDGASRSAGLLDTAGDYFRGALADVAAVKSRLCPLPDTAHELTCVARSLGANSKSIVLGKDMTETAFKSMPLDHYRIVHFATHGLLAGETAQLAKYHAEPALVFSPPDTATEEDDGLLTASEVAGLKLDADWAVLSACNTASGVEPGAEALSGLAKAFFYAGARALLVSHWPVNSYAATMLTSRTFAELTKEPVIGRSEAFRRAMLALMSDSKRPWAAHPSVWAPFVVVGEGGASAAH